MDKKAIVIGGGVHGLTIAIALAEKNVDVTLLEKNPGLFQRTSGATHNRAHLGYHYPRSVETAIECLNGFEYFKLKYPQALYYPEEAYYMISKQDSKTSSQDFLSFCGKVGIPRKEKFPEDEFLKKEHIESSIVVPEPVFNTRLLVTLLEQEADEKGVNIIKGSEMVGFEKRGEGDYIIKTKEKNKEGVYDANIIVNATYAYANNIFKILGLEEDMVKYKMQTTEVIVVKSKKPLPALTVMDGKFISIMPFAGHLHQNLYLVYDVINAVVHEEEGYFFDDSKRYPSNKDKIFEHGRKFFPFMDELEYIASLWGGRPIPLDNQGDSRQTRVIASRKHPGIYSILEGKFISAPMIAQNLVCRMIDEGII